MQVWLSSLICLIITLAIINYMRRLVIYYAELTFKRAILLFIYTLSYQDIYSEAVTDNLNALSNNMAHWFLSNLLVRKRFQMTICYGLTVKCYYRYKNLRA